MNLPDIVHKAEEALAASGIKRATKLVPIVSTRKALDVITKYWKKKYNTKPDMVVIEGPQAGGHLGFTREELDSYTQATYDEEIKSILSFRSSSTTFIESNESFSLDFLESKVGNGDSMDMVDCGVSVDNLVMSNLTVYYTMLLDRSQEKYQALSPTALTGRRGPFSTMSNCGFGFKRCRRLGLGH